MCPPQLGCYTLAMTNKTSPELEGVIPLTNFLSLTADRAAMAYQPRDLDYASLINRTSVRNAHSGETGVITGAANGLVEITLDSGPDAGYETTIAPGEVIANWRKA